MASLQSLKEKKFKQCIEIDYIDNKILMNQIDMHIAILFTSTAFTFNELGHCPMALQYYTLKLELKEISQQNFKQNSQ